MGVIHTSPDDCNPAGSCNPRWGKHRAMVSVAITDAPRHSPVSATIPEGRSTASTGIDCRLIHSIAVAR